MEGDQEEGQGVARSGKRPTPLSSGYASFLSMKLLIGLLLLPQDGMLVNCKKKEIIIMVILMYSVIECNLFLTFFHVLFFFF